MSIFIRFEDIEVWQKARILAKEISDITNREIYKSDRRLKSQIDGSSSSIMDNIAEGHGRGGNKEFIQFLWIAKGSSSELRSQLYRSLDKNFISETEFKNFYNKSDEISKMINGLINSIKKSGLRGTKYKDQ